MSNRRNRENVEEVETSPDGRYTRVLCVCANSSLLPTSMLSPAQFLCVHESAPYCLQFDEKLGTGAYKSVYLAYDNDTGNEVAWNTVDLRRMPPHERSARYASIGLGHAAM